MMKKLLFYTAILTLGFQSCIDEVEPIDYLLPDQVASMAASQQAQLDGLLAFVTDYSTYSSSDQYYTNDFGYPCQMMFREVQGSDFPVNTDGGDYNYWTAVEQSTSLSTPAKYTYFYYYRFIRNCNTLLGYIGNPDEAPAASRQYYGCALAFRALCYLDLARMFEYQPTGIATLDDEARKLDILGLTVPIVTDRTPVDSLTCNPRAPFYTMYRFINQDLNRAERYLNGYVRTNGAYPDQKVVYGLKARFWLEVGTRFELIPADLAAQLAHESDADGFEALGIQSATECYTKAADYARRAQQGFPPTTRQAWYNKAEAFNTATPGWIWYTRVATKEQQCNYYSTIMGTVCTEAEWGMCQFSGKGNFRCIGDALYDKIPDNDWRKDTWIAPDDATRAKAAVKNKDQEAIAALFPGLKERYNYNVSDSLFSTFPAYANLKWRSRNTAKGKSIEGMMCDIPLMRVEEMYLIEAEAMAHAVGVAEGDSLLSRFVRTYRYTDGKYACTAETMEDFTDELMTQRRIELWGEGLTFFDYKRLKLPVRRSENSNYIDEMKKDSKAGFVCPTMNYFIPRDETNANTALTGKRNPDPTNWFNKK